MKMHLMGVRGNVFNWVMEFLNGRSIQVNIQSVMSRKCVVENGTPQGSVISSVLFTIMINDLFEDIQPGIGRHLFVVYGKEAVI